MGGKQGNKHKKHYRQGCWYHISGVNNIADIPTRVCKINDFNRWFDGPQFLYTVTDVSKFGVWGRLKLVEAAVRNEAKVRKKNFEGVNSVNMFRSDFLMVLFTLLLTIVKILKKNRNVVFEVAAEHCI